ncbi:unnamed protein product, partial [Strongylus vulgaris]
VGMSRSWLQEQKPKLHIKRRRAHDSDE